MTHVHQLVLDRTILDSVIRDVISQRIDSYERMGETLRPMTHSIFLPRDIRTTISLF